MTLAERSGTEGVRLCRRDMLAAASDPPPRSYLCTITGTDGDTLSNTYYSMWTLHILDGVPMFENFTLPADA